MTRERFLWTILLITALTFGAVYPLVVINEPAQASFDLLNRDRSNIGKHIAAELEPVRSFNGLSSDLTALIFSPDNSLLATASSDGSVRLRQMTDGDVILEFEGHSAPVNGLAFSPDGKYMVISYKENIFFLTSEGTIIKHVQPTDKNTAYAQPTFSPDSQRVVFKYLTKTKNKAIECVTSLVSFSPRGDEISRIAIPSVLEQQAETEANDVSRD